MSTTAACAEKVRFQRQILGEPIKSLKEEFMDRSLYSARHRQQEGYRFDPLSVLGLPSHIFDSRTLASTAWKLVFIDRIFSNNTQQAQ